jgi:CRISPR-associated protein Cmr3
MTDTFTHLITLTPLGLLYGSAGKFLSPDNLVGRSGTHFPPSAATLSGIFAAHLSESQPQALHDLLVSGPFWSWQHDPQNFCVPTPINCLAKFKPQLDPDQIPEATLQKRLAWHAKSDDGVHWRDSENQPPQEKFNTGTWVKINDWETLASGTIEQAQQLSVYGEPWQFIPHLHPYLAQDQRKVDTERERGSLFLENGVQLHPDICLTYLANNPLPDGWYRFGGEGHMVDLTSEPLSPENDARINQATLNRSFAIITPAIWGSNRLSSRQPKELKKRDPQRHTLDPTDSDLSYQWTIDAMLTQKAVPTRYRLGDSDSSPSQGNADHPKSYPKRLSRGRYAVPAGSVYVLNQPFPEEHKAWSQWPTHWFPQEGPSLKRWGCGLALPLDSAVA